AHWCCAAATSGMTGQFSRWCGTGDIGLRPATAYLPSLRRRSSFPVPSYCFRLELPLGAEVDDEKKSKVPQSSTPLDPDGELERNAEVEDFFRKLMDKSEMRRPKPSPEAIAAALQAMQRLGVAGADDAAESDPESRDQTSAGLPCPTCGYANQPGNRFCGMCGRAVQAGDSPDTTNFASEEGARNNPPGPHHYHHHSHHHYFADAQAGEVLSSVLPQKSSTR